jgi:hypothetical protein
MHFDVVSGWMSRIGPDRDLLLVDEYRAELLWQIAVDEKTLVVAELQDERSMLVLSVEVGSLAPDKRADFFASMQQPHPPFWELESRARLGLDGTDDKLWLIQDLAVAGADYEGFKSELIDFLETLRGWRGVLDIMSAPPGQTGDEMLRTLSTDGLIRT